MLDIDAATLSQLAARICEDYPGNDACRVYYWPGILAPRQQALAITEVTKP